MFLNSTKTHLDFKWRICKGYEPTFHRLNPTNLKKNPHHWSYTRITKPPSLSNYIKAFCFASYAAKPFLPFPSSSSPPQVQSTMSARALLRVSFHVYLMRRLIRAIHTDWHGILSSIRVACLFISGHFTHIESIALKWPRKNQIAPPTWKISPLYPVPLKTACRPHPRPYS